MSDVFFVPKVWQHFLSLALRALEVTLGLPLSKAEDTEASYIIVLLYLVDSLFAGESEYQLLGNLIYLDLIVQLHTDSYRPNHIQSIVQTCGNT